MFRTLIVWLLTGLVLQVALGCNNSSSSDSKSSRQSQDPKFVSAYPGDYSESYQNADYRVLFVGNSHTNTHGIPQTIEEFMEAENPDVDVYCGIKSGRLLDEVAENHRSKELIKEGKWDVVVFQGQKISMSGKYIYPIEPAIMLCQLAEENGSRTILFSEWGIRGKEGDTQRTQEIYEGIAKTTGSELARVGAAWELSFKSDPELTLHANDGNHSNPQGAFLAALVLYSQITGKDPGEVPDVEVTDISSEQQLYFRGIASKLFNANSSKTKD